MSDNWIVQNLNSALSTWSEKMVELWTLLKDRRSVEIFQPEEVCSSLRTFRTDLRSMDLCKSFLIKEIPEPSYDSFLNPEFCTLSDISQRNRSVV